MDIHGKLKLLRKERGLTQSDVGMAIGQERSTIACYETGKRTPDVATLEKLARLYKVTLDHFSDKSEADTMIELLSRSNAFFTANEVSDSDKDEVYRYIMKLYLNSKEEAQSTNARQNTPLNATEKAREDKTVRF
jgi:transcriptional regulator with XRE-family HTH domain